MLIIQRIASFTSFREAHDSIGELFPFVITYGAVGRQGPVGSGESLGAFLELLGSHHCAVHCGVRAVRIFPEEMNPSAVARPGITAWMTAHRGCCYFVISGLRVTRL